MGIKIGLERENILKKEAGVNQRRGQPYPALRRLVRLEEPALGSQHNRYRPVKESSAWKENIHLSVGVVTRERKRKKKCVCLLFLEQLSPIFVCSWPQIAAECLVFSFL